MILGKDKLKDNLRIVGLRATQSARESLKEFVEAVGEKTLARTPIATGDLRGTLQIKQLVKGLAFTIQMGGPDAPYATIVHEDLSAKHPIGEAKFLEKTMAEASASFLPVVGRGVKLV